MALDQPHAQQNPSPAQQRRQEQRLTQHNCSNQHGHKRLEVDKGACLRDRQRLQTVVPKDIGQPRTEYPQKGNPQPAQETDGDPFPVIAFAVDDLDGALDRLKAKGVVLPWGVEADARARWVMFHDPAGNLIELVQSMRGIV